MLHHHPRIAIPYESGFLTAYQERAAEYGDLQSDAGLRRLVEALLAEPLLKMWDHHFDAAQIVARVTERSMAGVVDAVYSDYAAGKGKARWGDKSDYLDRIHLLNEMFPDAQFIHIVRDGRDVAQSVMKLPWGPNDIVQAAAWWNDHVWVARRVGAVLGKSRYMEVQYEHLVENAERELRRVCEFLGEAYSPDMLSYHRTSTAAIPDERRGQHYGADAPPDRSRAFAWKKTMNRYDVALFNRHAGRMLGELGYEASSAPVSAPGLWLRYMTILAARAFRST